MVKPNICTDVIYSYTYLLFAVGPYNNSMLSRTQQFQLSFEDHDAFQEDSRVSTPKKVIREIIV